MFALVAMALGAAGPAAAANAAFSLHYVHANVDIPPVPSPMAPRPSRTRRQEPMIPFWIKSALYSAEGTLLKNVNVTTPQDGAGYLDRSPDGTSLIFATEVKQPTGWSNVDTMMVKVNADGSKASEPRVLLTDASKRELMKWCRNAEPHPCTQVSTFHGQFTSDGTAVVFAYRAWQYEGDASGSQALAIADADGSNAKCLTCSADVQVMDMCPTLGPAGTVLFTRVTGSKEQVAVLDLATHGVTVRADLPLIPPGSGCPAWLGDPKSPNSFMFLGCKGDECDESVAASTAAAAAAGSRRASVWDRPARWGKPPTPAVVDKKDYAVFAQYKVTLDSVAASDHGSGNAELMFKIPTTAAPSHIGVYVTSQCDRVWGRPSNASIICQGADPTHLFFLKFGLNPTTGIAARNDTILTAVMTPRGYYLREN